MATWLPTPRRPARSKKELMNITQLSVSRFAEAEKTAGREVVVVTLDTDAGITDRLPQRFVQPDMAQRASWRRRSEALLRASSGWPGPVPERGPVAAHVPLRGATHGPPRPGDGLPVGGGPGAVGHQRQSAGRASVGPDRRATRSNSDLSQRRPAAASPTSLASACPSTSSRATRP